MVSDLNIASRIIKDANFRDFPFKDLAGHKPAAFGVLFLTESERTASFQVTDIDGRVKSGLPVHIDLELVRRLIPGKRHLMFFTVEQRGVRHTGIDLLTCEEDMHVAARSLEPDQRLIIGAITGCIREKRRSVANIRLIRREADLNGQCVSWKSGDV